MRAVAVTFAVFVLLALAWALHAPLASRAAMRRLSDPANDPRESARALLRAGVGSTRALQNGLAAQDPLPRLYCARLLALRGDRDGDRCLLDVLRRRGGESETLSAMAEVFLNSVWDQRGAPAPALRERVLRGSLVVLAREKAMATDELLSRHPAWSAGFVARARMARHLNEDREARMYALKALLIEPDNFEAMKVLARACLALGEPDNALRTLEQALRVNPRLKAELRDDIRDAIKAIDLDRARRRREKRKESPVA